MTRLLALRDNKKKTAKNLGRCCIPKAEASAYASKLEMIARKGGAFSRCIYLPTVAQ